MGSIQSVSTLASREFRHTERQGHAPVSRVVGDTAEFSVTIRNVAAVAAAKVELRFQCDTAIDLVVEQGVQRLQDGSLLVKLDRGLAANEQRVFPFHGQCKVPSDHVCAGDRDRSGRRELDGRGVYANPSALAGPGATGTP